MRPVFSLGNKPGVQNLLPEFDVNIKSQKTLVGAFGTVLYVSVFGC